MVNNPPLLVGSSGVPIVSSWTSAVASPWALSPPLCAWDLQTQVCFWTEGAVPCGAGGGVDGGVDVHSMLTDRPSIYSLLCLFSYMSIPLCQVSLGTLKGAI